MNKSVCLRGSEFVEKNCICVHEYLLSCCMLYHNKSPKENVL